ncbi:uncharacterized protein LOC120476154 [Pimephales promelas]|uniref:uncharacterized protein LOC120476154 n=1 Tax=Pimephales promelas TaxID=90988 RepID=UPI00195559A9|nr:uncharacterized protein LOC120476154 [Pimephales promelas]
MVDKDQAEINAIRKVFNESHVLLCWYHVTQAVTRWLSRSESGVSGPENADSRAHIMQLMSELKSCSTEHEFKKKAETFHCQFKNLKDVCKYFRNHWEPIGLLWSKFGRCYKHGDSETNNLIERFFHRLKYQFLCGVRNRRLDHLIDVLLNKTGWYFNIIQDLQSAGRIYNPLECKMEEIKKSAQRMLDNGWDTAVTAASTETYVYNVPSENNPHVVYHVCPAEQFCNCLAGTRGRTCKHLILLSLLTCGNGETFPDMDTQLQAHDNNLIQKNKYIISTKPHKTLEVEILFGRAVSKPCIVTNVCDCCTFSHHKKCACLLLAKGLLNEMSEMTSKHAINISVGPIHDEIAGEDRHSTTIRKLESILKTLQTWERIPEDIAHKVNELEEQTKKENINFKRFVRPCDEDNSRKIRPLFANRKRKTDRNTASETRTDVTSSFPIKSRRKHKAISGPKRYK